MKYTTNKRKPQGRSIRAITYGFIFLVALFLGLLARVGPALAVGSTLYEHYDTTGYEEIWKYNYNYFIGETFTTTSTHPIDFIRLRISPPAYPNNIFLYLIDIHSGVPFDCGNHWFSVSGIAPECVVASSTFPSSMFPIEDYYNLHFQGSPIVESPEGSPGVEWYAFLLANDGPGFENYGGVFADNYMGYPDGELIWTDISIGQVYISANWELHFQNWAGSNCSDYTSLPTCQAGGCYWTYFPGLTPFCSDVSYGSCGNGIFSCQNCNSSTTCEANSGCYWENNLCYWGTSVCLPGLEEFCDNASCSWAGGYWYEDFCWSEPESILTSWATVSTPWINDLASSSRSFLGKIGGFLAVFNQKFNIKDASEKGLLLGSVIPAIRGYCSGLDIIFGNFPLGELLVFTLIFTLAIGVFRIVRNLIQLFKFW
jgi:hypothetical protein